MEAAVVRLEESVLKADKTLDTIAWKLDEYEKQVVHVDSNEHSTQVSVLKLLRSVQQVREEYESLRREISEVQQLQKQLSDTLHLQLQQVQGTFGTLRDKIIGGSHQNN
jgi:predicted  nucleic acid-binding Zn-ribbon protein